MKTAKGKTILIHTVAGGLNGYAMQLAKLKGLKVFATCSTKNENYMRKLGADYVLDYNGEVH